MPHLALLDFSGGKNNTSSPVKLADNELREARNVILDPDGAVKRRLGSTKDNSAQISGTTEFGLIYQFLPEGGTSVVIVAYDDKIASWNGSSFTTILSGLTSNEIVLVAPYMERLFFMKQGDNPIVYNPQLGSPPYIFRAGQPQPTTAPTFNSNIAGSITSTGTILVRVRYVSPNGDYVFGEPYPEDGASITVTASGGVKINIPTYTGGGSPFDFEVEKRVIERTTVGGGIFFLDGYVNDNTTLTYDITQSDVSLTANEIMPPVGYRMPPPKLWPFTVFKNRMVGFSQVGKLVFSEIDEFGILPEAFPEINYHWLDIGDAHDNGRLLLPLGDDLICYCGRSIHTFNIDEAGTSYARRKGGYRSNVPGPRAGIELPDGHLILTYRGIYYFDGLRFYPASDKIRQTFVDWRGGLWEDAFAIHREDDRRVKFYLPGGSGGENNRVLVYNYDVMSVVQPEGAPERNAFSYFDTLTAKSGGVIRNAVTQQDEELVGSYDGWLYKEESGNSNDHDANGQIPSEIKTRPIYGEHPLEINYWEEAWLIVGQDSTNNINVEWETDFGQGETGSRTLEVSADVALWDTAIWDAAVWATSGDVKFLRVELGEDGKLPVGRYISFRIHNNAPNEFWRLVGILVQYEPQRIYD